MLDERRSTASFDCGEPSPNAWLHDRALANQARDLSRTYVAVDPRDGSSGRLRRFLVTAQVLVEELPRGAWRASTRSARCSSPAWPWIATSRDVDWAGGCSCARCDCALRWLTGSRYGAVIVDPLNKSAIDWYVRYGFAPLPGREDNRIWLPIKRIRASLWAAPGLVMSTS
ncbi:MAG: hypothetical protein ACRD0K_08080 [Egibacteraceae bacterium]